MRMKQPYFSVWEIKRNRENYILVFGKTGRKVHAWNTGFGFVQWGPLAGQRQHKRLVGDVPRTEKQIIRFGQWFYKANSLSTNNLSCMCYCPPLVPPDSAPSPSFLLRNYIDYIEGLLVHSSFWLEEPHILSS